MNLKNFVKHLNVYPVTHPLKQRHHFIRKFFFNENTKSNLQILEIVQHLAFVIDGKLILSHILNGTKEEEDTPLNGVKIYGPVNVNDKNNI